MRSINLEEFRDVESIETDIIFDIRSILKNKDLILKKVQGKFIHDNKYSIECEKTGFTLFNNLNIFALKQKAQILKFRTRA